ncbi:hypothetical protein MP638_004651 [Amoeboaphelidium occidentale]|nr:hypothetical protein MP638_004651 [Amoeboaphelidium occidentale]
MANPSFCFSGTLEAAINAAVVKKLPLIILTVFKDSSALLKLLEESKEICSLLANNSVCYAVTLPDAAAADGVRSQDFEHFKAIYNSPENEEYLWIISGMICLARFGTDMKSEELLEKLRVFLVRSSAEPSTAQPKKVDNGYKEALKKEKKEKELIKKQFELDRLNNSSKLSNVKTSPKEKLVGSSSPNTPPPQRAHRESTISVKLLPEFVTTESTVKQTFTSTSKLKNVREYLRDEWNIKSSNYYFTSVFPKKRFSAEDENTKTLEELGFCPGGVIFMEKSDVDNSNEGKSQGFVGYIFALLLWLLGLIKQIFTGRANEQETPVETSSTSNPSLYNSKDNIKTIKTMRDIETIRQRNTQKSGKKVSKDFDNDDDDQKREERYNGNSTNQE